MRVIVYFTAVCWAISFYLPAFRLSADEVDYVRDIQPILAEKCYACHGPDEATREAGLRFDIRQAALAELPSGQRAIVPGNAATSALVERILQADSEQRMPPPTTKKILTPSERQILRQWILEGAEFTKHWAFVSPNRPTPPLKAKAWGENVIDQFVYDRLLQNGMSPSSEADRVTLMRRLSFDLRGLPPSIAEVDAFLADQREDAYGKVVDEMLKSVHFGEKLAQDWLDLARYGDTNGYHSDSHRDMWLYRDWVIHAFHTNMPYDRFIREQLAGDLMPNATEEQRIASAFNRNAPFNEEGGADPDEFFVAYAVDRTNTTGQGLLGLTFGCAQCHSHKYDPISQTEYYEFLAFFNSVDGEIGGGGENGHHNRPVPPTFAAKSPLRHLQVEQLGNEIKNAQKEYEQALETAIVRAGTSKSFHAWVEQQKVEQANRSKSAALPITEGLVLHLDASDVNGNRIVDTEEELDPSRRLESWHDLSGNSHLATGHGAPRYLPQAIGEKPAIRFDGKTDFFRTATGAERLGDDFTILTVHRVWQAQGHQMLVMWGQEEQGKRRALWLTQDKLQFAFNGYSADVVGDSSLQLQVAYICSLTKSGPDHQIHFVLNGEDAGEGQATLSDFDNSAITIGANNAGAEHASIDLGELLIYDRPLSRVEQNLVGDFLAGKYAVQSKYDGVPAELAAVLDSPSSDWNNAQRRQAARFFAEYVQSASSQRLQRLRDQLLQVRMQRDTIMDAESTVMVMKSMPKRKSTFVLNRGDFQQPGELVTPDVPEMFPPLPSGELLNLLALGEWMTRPNNPLLSRVRVNHLWKLLFGQGLVRTPGDFGTQGAPPTHPELLDWLAVTFVDSEWDTKALIKQMVMSATYRQASIVTKPASLKDPENRWLSRAPRYRLSAEEIRDMALASSGLLQRKIGGKSVRPFQPANYFAANSGKQWSPSNGVDRLRRGIYTYWQRTAPYAAFVIFDAPSRQICTAQRSRTNTPLQALVTLNDPEFQQAARALAISVLGQQGKSDRENLIEMWRRVLSRVPNDQEMGILTSLLDEQRQSYQHLAVSVPKDVTSTGPAPREISSWTNVASAVLNLDEAITRE